MNIGIVSYGAYIPRYRVTVEEIAQQWGKDAHAISRGLRISEKSVPGIDEDTITISTEAALQALERSGVSADRIDALLIGSESHPYAVKPSSVTVATALGMNDQYFTVDTEFACKAGSASIQLISGLIAAGKAEYGVAIGADTAQGKPGDALEFTAAAGGAAFMLGSQEYEYIARIIDFDSFTSDTPDFWRGKHAKYPEHAERFTGVPAYFKHVMGAAKRFLDHHDMKPDDFDHAIFHMPNGKFPRAVSKKLGFSDKQISQGLVVDYIGNTYSGSSLLGLARVLDVAQPGEKIFMVSYGSGSGSDVFAFEVMPSILKLDRGNSVDSFIDKKTYLTYGQYASHVGKIA